MPFDIKQLETDLTQRAEELRAGARELKAIETALEALAEQPSQAPRASSSANRDRVLQAVTDAPSSPATAIAAAAGVSAQTATKHLLALQEAGRVGKDDHGRWIAT